MKLLKSGIAYFENNLDKKEDSTVANLNQSSINFDSYLKAAESLNKAIQLIENKSSLKQSQSEPSLKTSNQNLIGLDLKKENLNNLDDQYKCQLTSDELKRFDLNYGLNKIEYSVTSGLQGTKTISANIFLWNHTDKIVISDIDGTITKSDIMGQIAAVFKQGWFHDNVAEFFNQLDKRSYKIIYLSARSICQADITRNLVRSVNQNNIQMPAGPILLNPNQIFSAFKTELITKTAAQIKLICLENIKTLFGDLCSPFYAGFGNRDSDATTYRTMFIPDSHIFLINADGLIATGQNNTFTYTLMSQIIDDLFN